MNITDSENYIEFAHTSGLLSNTISNIAEWFKTEKKESLTTEIELQLNIYTNFLQFQQGIGFKNWKQICNRSKKKSI